MHAITLRSRLCLMEDLKQTVLGVFLIFFSVLELACLMLKHVIKVDFETAMCFCYYVKICI